MRFLTTIVALVCLALASAPAQLSTGSPPVTTQPSYQITPGQPQTIAVDFGVGFAGGKGYLVLSGNQDPSTIVLGGLPLNLPFTIDAYTNTQILVGWNWSGGGVVLQTKTTIRPSGKAYFQIQFPLSLAGLTFFATPVGVSPSGAVVVAIAASPVSAIACPIGGPCGGPGGTYLGPGDTVPPWGPGGGPGGSNYCGQGPTSCGLSEAADPIGCAAPSVVINGSTVYTGPLNFGCTNGDGQVSEITLGMLQGAIASAQAAGIEHIDICWTAWEPLQELYIYPVKGLQQFCLQWLAHGPYDCGCEPMQVCNELVGSPASTGAFNTLHGFFSGSCNSSDWHRAYGQNTACITDLTCWENVNLTGIRLRLRVDCLDWIIQTVLAANPGFWTSNSPLIVFAGEWCPF